MKRYYMDYPDKLIEDNAEIFDCLRPNANHELTIKGEYYDYDFNSGFRIKFKEDNKKYTIIIKNKDNNQLLFSTYIITEKNTIYEYLKKYFINYEIIIFNESESQENYFPLEIIRYNPDNKNILIYVSGDSTRAGIGDSIAWIQGVALFKDKFKDANIFVSTSSTDIDELIENSNYKNKLNIIQFEDTKKELFYATYLMGCFFDDTYYNHCKLSYKLHSLIEYSTDILNVDLPQKDNPIIYYNVNSQKESKKHYVCIGIKASSPLKCWFSRNNGWEKIIDFLKYNNYDIYCIDEHDIEIYNGIVKNNIIPKNVIDKTGNISLNDRAKLLKNADFFIGVSSGLSWLAWYCNIPVVLISGFTNPLTEFNTKYRLINYTRCNSCWNTTTKKWDISHHACNNSSDPFSDDFLICSTSITYNMVIDKIKKIPNFINYTNNKIKL